MKHKTMMKRNSELCMAHHKVTFETWKFNMDDQYVFVQYYDIFGEGAVPKHFLGSIANRIILKWERH